MKTVTEKNAATTARRTAAPTPAQWCVGVIQADGHGALMLHSGGLKARATRAVSCLLEPQAGDSVACLRVAPDEVWVIAVLQREEGVSNVLSCQGDTVLRAEQGELRLEASRLHMASEQLDIATGQTRLASDSVEVVGRQLRVVGTAIKVVGSLLSTVMDRVNHFSKHHLRTTEGIDRVSATHVECEARQLMRLDAQHTLITGQDLVKARGGQIHFG
jgi:hypothetical protein